MRHRVISSSSAADAPSHSEPVALPRPAWPQMAFTAGTQSLNWHVHGFQAQESAQASLGEPPHWSAGNLRVPYSAIF